MGSDRQPRVAELLSPEARAALDEWTSRPRGRHGRLGLASFLRERFDPPLARALALQLELRTRAASKFREPERILFHRKGLEQATRLDVATWRARRIRGFAPQGAVADATCGLGADAIALLAAGLRTVALESDTVTAEFALHNLRAATGAECVVLGTAERPPVRAGYWVVDPDRREGGARSLDPERWSPPLAAVLALARGARGACVKLAPAVDLERCGLGALGGAPWRPSWVSAGGELRECSLWCGEWAAGARPGEREVVVLDPEGGERATFVAQPERTLALDPDEAREVRWLAEPDPAVIRSGLLGAVARRAGARPLSSGLAFLGAQQRIDDPLLTAWRVGASWPFDLKCVKSELALRGIGSVELRVRGHPESADALARRLAGRGSARGLLAVARLDRGHQAYLLER